MVAVHAKLDVVLREPEIGENDILLILRSWRENKHKCRDIRSAGKVESAIADAPFQRFFVHGKGAGVPLLHWHPADGLLHPLVQPELPKGVFLCRILHRAVACVLHLVDVDRDAQRRVRFLPYRRVCPVLALVRAVDHRIERRVNLAAFEDILRLLVYLVADGVDVVARRGNEKIQRLHTGVAGPLRHYIEEFPIRLGVKLIKHHAVDIETVLGICLGGQYLIKTVRRKVDNPLLRGENLHPLPESWAHAHHVGRNVKDDAGLLAVSGAAIHLGAFLAVPAAKKQCNGGGKLALPLLLRYFDVRHVELPIPVLFQDAEEVSDNLFLPADEFKLFPVPSAFCVFQTLDKAHGKIRRSLVVMGAFRHETGRLVFWFTHRIT